MIDFANSPNALLIYFSAALAVLFAASYVLLVIRSCLMSLTRMRMMAYAAYAGLVFSAITLAFAANLFGNGFWSLLVPLLLVGVLLAPHALLHLGVGKHSEAKSASSLRMSQQH